MVEINMNAIKRQKINLLQELRIAIHYLLFLLLAIEIYSSDDICPAVRIPQGVLKGKFRLTVNGRKFSSFTGIPYAIPPIKERRFEMSEAALPWNGVLDATKPHNACPQSRSIYSDPEVYGNEDCLYLNVYTPVESSFTYYSLANKCPSEKLYPVMIFLHGIGFFSGNANFAICNPTLLLDKDVVLVVPNYRLGVLGFFSTGDDLVSGNNGLKDQVLAIKWVKKNIAYFGGNPSKMTLFGQSAGAASAHFHMLSSMSKTMFDQVICESGTALAPWALSKNDHTQKNSRAIAKYFSCPLDCNKEMIECLKSIDSYDLILQQEKLFYEWNLDPINAFRPVVEPLIENAFLTEEPCDIIVSDKSAKIPLIIGLNLNDGALKSSSIFAYPELVSAINEDFENIAPMSLLYSSIIRNSSKATKQLRRFYFANKEINYSNMSKKRVTNMYTDALFMVSSHKAVELHFKYTSHPVYYYAFGLRGSVSYNLKFGDPNFDYGACHCDELIYLFNHKHCFYNYKPSKKDRCFADFMVKLWTDFVIYGKPTASPNCTTCNRTHMWKPVVSQNLEYYYINSTTPMMGERLFWTRYNFWKSWFNEYAMH